MTLIELLFFIFNAAIGFLFARFAYSSFGLIPAIIAFPLGFLASIGVLKAVFRIASYFEDRRRNKKDKSN